MPAPLVVDSVTHLDASARGRVVVCGSHAGAFSGGFAARRGVAAIVLNDAAVGKDGAGVAGLALLDRHGIPAAAVAAASATIGDGGDTLRSGVVSHVNAAAASCGCRVGMTVSEATTTFAGAAPTPPSTVVAEESRHLLDAGPPAVWALDSASAAGPDDAGAVLVTGSHANLLGGRPETALKTDALLALFNDAGSDAGTGLTRLPALDARGVAAAAVGAQTARIGDGRSTYEDGVVSAVNRRAAALGAETGMTVRELVSLVIREGREVKA